MSPYGFVIPLAAEGVTQLEACLGFLRAAYPHAPATVISDGFHDDRYVACCRRHRVRYIRGTYLKRIECGGAWWRRVFEVGLSFGVPWIVKLDPDSLFCRPFRGEPPYDVCGTLEGHGTEYENVQGGCQAISAHAAKRLLASGLCEDPVLRSHAHFAHDVAAFKEWNARAFFCSDKTLLWMTRNAGIRHGHWDECGCHHSHAPHNHGCRYAVTHPHKYNPDPKCRGAHLQVITTCKGRLHHLKKTLPHWVAEPGVDVVVVDYDCPQGTAAWVRKHYPRVTVVHAHGLPRFNLAHARNLGAAAARDGWWCFFDADWLCKRGWSHDIRESIRHRHYLLARPIEWSDFGSVVLHSYDFRQAGGYDELFRAWGSEDSDLYLRLRFNGIRPGHYPARHFSSLKHDEADRTEFYNVKDIFKSRDFYDRYIALKRDFMFDNKRLPTLQERIALLQRVPQSVEENRQKLESAYNALYQGGLIDVPVPSSVEVLHPLHETAVAEPTAPAVTPLSAPHPSSGSIRTSSATPVSGPFESFAIAPPATDRQPAAESVPATSSTPTQKPVDTESLMADVTNKDVIRMDCGRHRPMTWERLCDLLKDFAAMQQHGDQRIVPLPPTAVAFTAGQWHDLVEEGVNEPHASDRRQRLHILASDVVLGMQVIARDADGMTLYRG